MSLVSLRQSLLRGIVPRVSGCLYCTKSDGTPPKQPAKKSKEKPAAPTVKAAAPEEIDDNTSYQCDSYLKHDTWSFYDVEAQMMARRVGQPSSKEPLVAPQ